MSRCKVCAVAVRREWARSNPAAHRAHVRKWRLANPEKMKIARRRDEGIRRARKRGVAYESIDPVVVLERDGHRCGICNEEIVGDFHLDHVVPLAKGGPHLYSNVQAAHPSCNIKKGAK
jgi:5-methylcytosine-specific restriction endonuclease McrA